MVSLATDGTHSNERTHSNEGKGDKKEVPALHWCLWLLPQRNQAGSSQSISGRVRYKSILQERVCEKMCVSERGEECE